MRISSKSVILHCFCDSDSCFGGTPLLRFCYIIDRFHKESISGSSPSSYFPPIVFFWCPWDSLGVPWGAPGVSLGSPGCPLERAKAKVRFGKAQGLFLNNTPSLLADSTLSPGIPGFRRSGGISYHSGPPFNAHLGSA